MSGKRFLAALGSAILAVAVIREWMVRAYGVTLGISVTRPIVGAFFAARRLRPQQFFGTAFWLGFTISLLAAERWLMRTRPTTAFRENSQASINHRLANLH